MPGEARKQDGCGGPGGGRGSGSCSGGPDFGRGAGTAARAPHVLCFLMCSSRQGLVASNPPLTSPASLPEILRRWERHGRGALPFPRRQVKCLLPPCTFGAGDPAHPSSDSSRGVSSPVHRLAPQLLVLVWLLQSKAGRVPGALGGAKPGSKPYKKPRKAENWGARSRCAKPQDQTPKPGGISRGSWCAARTSSCRGWREGRRLSYINILPEPT